jgi:phosphatidylserine/phosphatidylglycerophosphate/cardiolipin synthase-like enzyme
MDESLSVRSLDQTCNRPEPTISPERSDAVRRIVKPGRNCWRIADAKRAAVLIDGASYFEQLEAALLRARRSILILGWDFDGRIRLRPNVEEDQSQPLGPFLRWLVETRPELEIHILVWSVAVLHAPGAPMPLLFGAQWQEHPRIHLRLDTFHPIYAAHHQKVVCIDEALAFVGGIDLTVRRWDTSQHDVDDLVRVSPDARRYDPVHDIQMAVDGEAARAIAELARCRWRVATGEELAPIDAESDPWPATMHPDFTDIPIAIARTMPAWGDQPAIAEVAALTACALKAARRVIYIESQYLTANFVGDILADHLSQESGPEIVILVTLASHGWAEHLVMGKNRDRLIHRLKQADRFDRLSISYPVVPAPEGPRQVLIHSKLIIVDDVFLRVGSSNLNNRSIGLDTECDLAIEATSEKTRQTIAAIRNRLLAEHLDVSPETVTRNFAAEGSLVRTIRRLNTGPRGLRALDAMTEKESLTPVFGTRLLDPKRPFEPLWFLRRRRRRR